MALCCYTVMNDTIVPGINPAPFDCMVAEDPGTSLVDQVMLSQIPLFDHQSRGTNSLSNRNVLSFLTQTDSEQVDKKYCVVAVSASAWAPYPTKSVYLLDPGGRDGMLLLLIQLPKNKQTILTAVNGSTAVIACAAGLSVVEVSRAKLLLQALTNV